MLVTVTNTSGVTLNALASETHGSGPSGVVATGGAKVKPLPYPFGHIGSLAAAGTKQLPMHPSDWRYKSVPWVSHEPAQEWNDLVQKGWVTLAYAAETGRRDAEELFTAAV